MQEHQNLPTHSQVIAPKPDPPLSVSMGNQPCPSMERAIAKCVTTYGPPCIFLNQVHLFAIQTTELIF